MMSKTTNSTADVYFIPGGEFQMGISKQTAEQLVDMFFTQASGVNPYIFQGEAPAHPVTVRPFYISKHEVTNQEFSEFVKAGGYSKLELWKEWTAATGASGPAPKDIFIDRTGVAGPAGWQSGHFTEGKKDHPVEGVSWYEAVAYCRWKKQRLPAEAEWEFAARGTDGRMFPWGNDFGVIQHWGDRQAAQTSASCTIPEDRSPFGVMDLSRNVSEWTSDAWSYYPDSMFAETCDESCAVVRGGNYASPAFEMRTTFRFRRSKLDRLPGLGFRTAQASTGHKGTHY